MGAAAKPFNPDRAAFIARMGETMAFATKVKAALKAKGKRSGWTKCPCCGGKVRAVLCGRKDHLHMACETDGCVRMMQ